MATLENLNFAVILDDSKFNDQIGKAISKAEDFNRQMTEALSLAGVKGGTENLKKMADALKNVTKEQENLNKAIKASPAEKITIKHRDAISATNAKMIDTARLLRTIGTLTGGAFSVYGLRRFLSTLIDVTGQFEVQKMALRTMLQDIDAADKIFQDLYRFSSSSTYRFSELAKYSKQLAAFNIGGDSLLETTKMLGDVASGVGVSMDRIILAYGHVKSSGFLRGIQLRSFSQNGVPILDELAKMIGEVEDRTVSLGEVFDKMTKREIPFEMVEQAFKNMTSEGGKFYQMQEVLAKTLAGQINILKGRWENLMYAVGESQDGLLKGAVSSISNLIADYENFGRAIQQIVITFGAYKTSIIICTALTDGLKVAFSGVIAAWERFSAFLAANPFTLYAAAIAAVTLAIIRHTTALKGVERIQDTLTKTEAKFTEEIARQNIELDTLFLRLHQAKKGTEEYDSAKKAISSRYGEYISQLRQEGIAVDDLASVYDKLKKKIEDAAKERFLYNASQDLDAALKAGQEDWLSKAVGGRGSLMEAMFDKHLNRKPTETQKNAYKSYLLGLTDVKGLRATMRQMPDAGLGEVISLIEGYGVFGTYTQKRTEYIRKNLAEVADAYRDGINGLTAIFDTAHGAGGRKSTPAEVRDWVNRVNKELNKLDPDVIDKVGLRPKDDEDYFAYLERIRNELKEINSQKEDALEANKPKYDAWIDAINRVDAALEGKVVPKTTTKTNSAKADEWDEILEAVDKELIKSIDEGTKQFEKDFERRQKALADFDNFIDKLEHTSGESGGEGASAKARDYLLGYKEADYKVLIEYRKQLHNLKDAFGENSAAYINSKRKLDEWRKSMEEANKAELFEKMRGLVDDIFKDGMSTYDLTNWSDKTLEQILNIKKAIESLDIPDDMKKDLATVQGLLDYVIKALAKYKAEYNQNTTDPEAWKKQIQNAKMYAAYITKAANSLAELGEAMDNQDLSGFAELLNNFADTWQAIFEGYEKDGAIGAIVGAAMTFLEKFIGYVAEAQKEERLMREAILNAAEEARNIKFDESLKEGVETLFGEDTIKSIYDAATALKDLSGAWDELLDKFSKVRESEISHYVHATGGGGGQGESIRMAREALRSQINSIEDLVFSDGKNLITIKQAAEQLGYDLYDSFGNINPDLLDQIIKVFNLEEAVKKYRVDSETLEYLKALSEYGKDYAKAMEQIENAVSEVFGSVADSMVDSFLENFKRVGNAVDDLGETFVDLGETIVKSMLKSYILDTILKKYEDDAKKMMADYAMGGISYDELAQRVSDFATSVTSDVESAKDVINAMLAAFQSRGLLGEAEGTDKNNIANGIKGITEDTASLLASYINAIRADVAMLRLLAQQGWSSVSDIADFVGILPTLNDHIARIEAHNANIERNTQQILTELQGVIVNEGSGRGFRSYPS